MKLNITLMRASPGSTPLISGVPTLVQVLEMVQLVPLLSTLPTLTTTL